MSSKQVLKDAEERMEKAVGVFLNELKGLRTGRATPGLVENLRIDAYGGGSETPLKQLAQISVPEPQQIVIKPLTRLCLRTLRKPFARQTSAWHPATTAS